MKMLLRDMSGVPIVVAGLAAAGFASPVFWIAAGTIGGAQIIRDSIQKIRERRYSLDYIALLAVVLSLATGQYLAGAVVALMITGGEALDAYASRRAENALRALADRIPKSCTIRLSDGTTIEKPIQDVAHGETILVRAHEIVPLDGILRSPAALLDSANLTGEAIPVDFTTGAFIKSGNINVGDLIELSVDGSAETSTYHRIVHLVDDAKQHQPHAVRLAERVNFPFTAITLVLATIAWLISGELTRALAVLVIATPCPLLIAAPVAFIGGMSRAAHRNIIVKRPATLETLDRVSVVFFDKTGTLTLGEPSLAKIEILQSARTEDDILSIAASIELRSIHPLARTIVNAARAKHLPAREAHDTRETIGSGIRGTIDGSRFSISRSTHATHSGIVLALTEENTDIALFHFRDEIKADVGELFRALTKRNIEVTMLTGDSKENAKDLFGTYGIPIRAGVSPEEKFAAIDEMKRAGKVVAMIGDGLNDAPALARADVGIVFSGTENSASIEAAHVAILGRDVMLVHELFDIAHTSTTVARESIWGGVALSTIGMIFAALGHIPPIEGAVLQEIIDMTVILNSLRAAANNKTKYPY